MVLWLLLSTLSFLLLPFLLVLFSSYGGGLVFTWAFVIIVPIVLIFLVIIVVVDINVVIIVMNVIVVVIVTTMAVCVIVGTVQNLTLTHMTYTTRTQDAQPHSTNSAMASKRKTDAAHPSAPKKSKPAFCTPQVTATSTGFSNSVNQTTQPSSSKNRVVTLRTNAAGRRGYRTQDLTTIDNSNTNSDPFLSPDLSNLIPSVSDVLDDSNSAYTAGPETSSESVSAISLVAKQRSKQKNTTTVR